MVLLGLVSLAVGQKGATRRTGRDPISRILAFWATAALDDDDENVEEEGSVLLLLAVAADVVIHFPPKSDRGMGPEIFEHRTRQRVHVMDLILHFWRLSDQHLDIATTLPSSTLAA